MTPNLTKLFEKSTQGPCGMPDRGKGLIAKKGESGWAGMIATFDCGDYACSRTEGLANARKLALLANHGRGLVEALEAILAADARGQGLPFQEAMNGAARLLARLETEAQQ